MISLQESNLTRRACTYFSLVNLTALTVLLKLSSPMHLKLKSSQRNTLFVANFGRCPPPTSARILVLNIISTMPMPPSSSIGFRKV